MDDENLKAVVESLLFAAGEPLSLNRLAAVLDEAPKEALRQALAELAADCNREGRGIVLTEVAGGYQLRTAKAHAPWVRKLLAARPPRLSRPTLETVAIIAYRQPITRPEIEQLRGVDSGAVLDSLLERRLVRVVGRKEAPGRPQLYATTPEFLETFGLKDLDSLPDLSELREVEQQIEMAEQQRLERAEGADTAPEAAPARPLAAGEQAAEETAEQSADAAPAEQESSQEPEQDGAREAAQAQRPAPEPASPSEAASAAAADEPAPDPPAEPSREQD